MTGQFDYWGLLAGIALFLFAMAQLESGLKLLGGRSLANYLKNQAGHRLNAVIGGIISTAVLQSSSVVALMVLAFTGAGMLNLTSALGIIFGSNLGTTATGWIVATLGFKFEIFELALPLTGIGGLTFLFARGRWAEYGRAVLSLGLLLLGLQLMKSSVASVEQLISIEDLAGLAPWQYLIFGTVVAAIIQSSSATMMITLAALYSGVITLPNAAVIAIGANLGTTTTVLIGAIRGSPVKQQVAAGHVIFNIVTNILAYLLRTPLLALIALSGIENPLYALVAFHSLFNFLGLIIFVPLTGHFARQLERLIPVQERHEASYLGEVSSGVSEAAVGAIERETSLLITRVVRLTIIAFTPALRQPDGSYPAPYSRGIENHNGRDFNELYNATKTLEGELVEFTIRLQADSLNAGEPERLSQLLRAAREALHSAKEIKDIRHNLTEFEQPGQAIANQYAASFRHSMQEFIEDIFHLRQHDSERISFEDLANAQKQAYRRHDDIHEKIYTDVRNNKVAQTLVSSLLNVNRELLLSNCALLLALSNYHLDKISADDFERIRF